MYDYVIVGAGSAGCVLAARLSEDPDVKVALLEAGGQDSRPEIAMPIAFPMLLKSSVDWDLFGEEEPGLGGRRLYLPRGKVLGGSGSINAMIYVRGNRADFDGWAAGGADGLELRRGAAVLQALRGQRARRGRVPRRRRADERVRQPRHEPADRDDDRGERRSRASSTTPTSTAPRQEGVGRFQLTQRNGRRCSTAAAFLHPAAGRPNLDVITDAMALRILFDGSRAVGVEVARDGKVEEIRAEREVILSAGAYQSPVLLMISGIGPAEDLEPYGIEVRENLPVGHNLQDHCMAQLNYETDEPSLFGAFTPENFELFEKEGRGPLTSNIPEAAAFFRTRPELEAPDIEFHFAPSMFYDEGLTAPHDSGYCFGPVVVKPTSRGRVKLRAPLADSKPRVLCNFLATEEDRASDDRGRPDGARDRRAGAAAEGDAQAVQRAGRRFGRGDHGLRPARGADRLPPDLDLRDRGGRRPGAARVRHRRPAGRRRVGDADDHAREHERRDDHDRREGRGPDQRLGRSQRAERDGAVGPRSDVRRLPRVRADDALREPGLDRDLAPHRPAGGPPVRARAARELGRRHGDGLGDRARRAGARDPAHDPRARQRGQRACDGARQPRRRSSSSSASRTGAISRPSRSSRAGCRASPGTTRSGSTSRSAPRTCPARSPGPTTRRRPGAGRPS